MPAFRVNGSTGQAPTTSFFGAIPDRYNMLLPGHNSGPVNGTSIDDMHAANNVNQFTIYNTNFNGGANALTASLGALTTAPDGTNTAQKIVETTTNSIHMLSSTTFPISTVRFAVFAKAAERTRIALYVQELGSPLINTNGCVTVFDLAGGQIGVANTAVNNGDPGRPPPWSAGPASITPFSNGWYLCMMDVNVGGFSTIARLYGNVFIDAGSGTGAQDLTYAGDASKGLYTWRATMLPPAAWGMSYQKIFFEGFDDPTKANFDLTDSKAPGFLWYLHNRWPAFNGDGGGALTPTNPASLSVSGSVLTLAPGGQTDLSIMTGVWQGGTSFIDAFSFQPPVLIECVVGWTANVNPQFTSTVWTTSFERLLGVNSPASSATIDGPGVELDIYESQPGGQTALYAGSSYFNEPQPPGHENGPFLTSSTTGIVVWQSAVTYNATTVVYFNGQIYQAQILNTGHQPDISPTQWSVYDPQAAYGGPPAAKTIAFDSSQFHTLALLWTPATFVGGTQPGMIVCFMDGNLTFQGNGNPADGFSYDPSSGGVFYVGDGTDLPIMIGTGGNFNTFVDSITIYN